MGKKTGIERVLVFFSRYLLPFVCLYAGLTRVSVVSFYYLCSFFIHFSWSRGKVSFFAFLTPCISIVFSLGSLILKGCVIQGVELPPIVLVLFGLCTEGHGSYVTPLYFVADSVVLVFALLNLIVLSIAARKKRVHRARVQLDHAIQKELSNQPDRQRALSTASDSEGEDLFPFFHRNVEDSGSDSDSDSDTKASKKGEPEEEDDAKDLAPKRLHLVWNISLMRSLVALFVAALAGAAFPSILSLPYMIFCVVAVLYLAIPRREHTTLSLPILVNVTGIFIALYIFLHMVTIYAYQMYYNYFTFLPEYTNSSSSSSSSFSSSEFDLATLGTEDNILINATVDVNNDWSNEYLGLFSYDTFLQADHWPVIISYLLPFLLYMILSPVNRSIKRVTDSYAEEHNKEFFEESVTEVLVILADQVAPTAEQSQQEGSQHSNAKSLAARAVYPHAWKLAMFALLCVALVSGGMLMFALVIGVLIETVIRPYKAAKWGTVLFYFYFVFIMLDYIINIPHPISLWLYENYPDIMEDVSFTYQEREFCGLFFGLQLWLVFLLAMFMRLRNEYLLHHALLKKVSRSMRIFRKSEIDALQHMSQAVTMTSSLIKSSQRRAGEESSSEDFSSSSSSSDEDEPQEPFAPQATAVAEVPPVNKTLEWRVRNIIGHLRMGFMQFVATMKALLTRGLIAIIRFSYIVSLVFLYFVSIRGINAINFVFILFFLVFAAKPTVAKRGWYVLVYFSQVVLLLRFLWQMNFMPENNTVTNIIGLNKDKQKLAINTLYWEVLLVIFVTIQRYIIEIEEETLARERSRRFALSSEDADTPVAEKKKAGNSKDKQGGDSKEKKEVETPQAMLASMSKENELPLLDKIVTVILVWVRRRGLFICAGTWMLMGVLMPISVVSLSLVCMAMLCTTALYFAKNPNVYMQQLWWPFLLWLAVVLFAEYSFQLHDLYNIIASAYAENAIHKYVTLDEFGLHKFTDSQMFVGLLPYTVAFVLAIMQWNFFSLTKEDYQIPDDTIPKPLLGVLDFVRRLVFVYLPFTAFLFAGAHFIMCPSAVRLLFLLVILFSRCTNNGFDSVGGFIMTFCNIMILATLAFNLHALDFFADKHPSLFKWIGLPRQYVYSAESSIEPHTEVLAMTYEYIVLVIFILVQHLSLRWGEEIAFHIHSAASSPRSMPLLSFLDRYPSWNQPRKDRHPWRGFLFTLCDLPNLLTRQTCYFFLCLLFYLRSSTFMGLWYLVAFIVCCNCRRGVVRKIGRIYMIVDIILILIQYFTMLGLPNGVLFPWIGWNHELQRWLLLYVPYSGALVLDVVLVYFMSAALHSSETASDIYSLIQTDRDDMYFLYKPRTPHNEFRYIFLHFSVVVMMLVLFFVATSKSCVISFAFLIGSIVLMFKGDFNLHHTRPWNIMAFCLYAMCFLQIVFQVIVVLLRQFNSGSESTDTVIYIAGFLGISFTTSSQFLPDESTQFLFGLLLLLSIMRSMMINLRHEFYVTRVYTAEMRVIAQNQALSYLRYSIDSVIAYIEEVFNDRLKRRERLETLRESRKRKQLLFPDLAAEIEDDASSVGGGSYLSAEEARYQKDDLVVEKEKKKLTFKDHLKRIGAAIASAWLWCVDHLIFWLHGKEGQVDGAHYARDLKALKEERAIIKQKKLEEDLQLHVEEENEGDGSGSMLTEEALSQLSASINARDLVYALVPSAERLKFQYQLEPMRDVFAGGDLILSRVCHMNVGTKISNLSVLVFIKRLRVHHHHDDSSSSPVTPMTPTTPSNVNLISLGEQLCKIASSLSPEEQSRKYSSTDLHDMTLAELCYIFHHCVHESRHVHSLAQKTSVRDFFVHLCHLFPPVVVGSEESEHQKEHNEIQEMKEHSFYRQRAESVFTAVVDTREDSDSGAEDDDAHRNRDLFFGSDALLREDNVDAFQYGMTEKVERPKFLMWEDSRKNLLADANDEDEDDEETEEEGGGFGGSRRMSRMQLHPIDAVSSPGTTEDKSKDEFKRHSRAKLFWIGLSSKLEHSTETICLVTFVLNHLLHGSIVSLIYVLFGFGYVALAKRPNPKKKFWNVMMIYTSVIVLLKFLVKLPGVCLCRTSAMHIWSFSYHNIFSTTSVQCPEAACLIDSGVSATYFSPPYLFGVVPSTDSFWGDVVTDIICLLAIAFHRLLMDKQGLWSTKMEHERSMENARYLKRKNELLSRECIASPTHLVATCDHEGKNDHYLSFKEGQLIHVISRGHNNSFDSIGEIDGHTGLFKLAMTKPAPAELEEIDEDVDQELGFNDGPVGEMNDDDPKKKKQRKKNPKKNTGEKNKRKRGKKGKKNEGPIDKIKNSGFVKFYDELINDKTRIGNDYYAVMFTVEFVCLVYLLFFGASFTGSRGSLIEYVSQSYIPGLYVFLLILQFIIIIIDRIIYLCQSLLWKVILQYVTVVGFSLIMMWWFPVNMEMTVDTEAWHAPFTQSSSLQFFFVLKCVYWFVSALQIRDGYRVVSGERFLMRRYNTYSNWIHQAYRCIPFLYELRTILDWTFIPTTLDFFDYLRVEDIYADVYKVACLAAARTPRKPGTNRSCGEKCGMGCSLFLLLAALLWLPLIILSSALPGMSGVEVIPVTTASMQIQMYGYAPLYSTDIANVSSNPPAFTEDDFISLRKGRTYISTDMDTLQPLEFPSFSSKLWNIPYASKDQLALLFETTNITLETTFSFTRDSSSNSKINVTFRTPLKYEEQQSLAETMRTGLGASTTITHFVPRFLKMPGSSGDITTPCITDSTIIGMTSSFLGNSSGEDSCVPITMNFTYHGCFSYGCNGNESSPADYWSVFQVAENPDEDGANEMSNSYFNKTDLLQIILIHVPVSKSSNVIGTLAAYGLIGIYATIILAIARVIRTMMSGQTDDVMFICLPDPQPLVRLSKDIILARMDGDLLLEEQLANEIIQIYRSPESLIENTRIQASGSVGGHGKDDDDDDIRDDENDDFDDDD